MVMIQNVNHYNPVLGIIKVFTEKEPTLVTDAQYLSIQQEIIKAGYPIPEVSKVIAFLQLLAHEGFLTVEINEQDNSIKIGNNYNGK